jgi:hypothetical protein
VREDRFGRSPGKPTRCNGWALQDAMNSRRVSLALLLLLTGFAAHAAEPSSDADDLAPYDARIKPSHRKHWSFQPVTQPAVPIVKDTAWVRNPIDAFILARLEDKGWNPSPPAEPRALLRRVYLDLVGLPPTPGELDAFLKNPTPAVLDAVVEELLSRPAHGERWGRHWLDLVRYAETNGFERDAAKPHVWRYRDYVLRAFNADKPFDRFILEQLAGDELPDADAETLIATGYYRLGPWDDEPADPKEDRFDQLDDMVSTTAQVFLGLTLGCARCHNHKFEPLTAHDYYRMVAVFNTLQRPQNGRTELDRPAGTRAQVRALTERDERLKVVRLSNLGLRLAAVGDPLAALGAVATEKAARDLRAALPDLPRGYFMHEPGPAPPPTHILLRGSAARQGPQVAAGVPAVLVSAQPAFLPPDEHTSRRRLTLARWIASADNPLTARVIVNRVWQFHFGEGLVRTPSDFGVMGSPPTHPELLDWLARRFVEDGWSLKKLHRLILASNTYRMSKRSRPECSAEDPENLLLWRVPYRRLEVEAIRDSMLAVSEQLNPKMYGPSMYPHVPKEALEGSSDPDKIWKASDEHEAARRTVYAHVKRSMIVPLLEVLDVCDTTRTAAKRNVTSVAPQALTLLNGDFTNRQARHFAERLVREVGADADRQIERAYGLALGRPPTTTEREATRAFLRREAENDSGGALAQMCRVIFNLNEFVYPD